MLLYQHLTHNLKCMRTDNVTPERLTRGRELVRNGSSIREAAREVGMSYFSLYKHINPEYAKKAKQNYYSKYDEMCCPITGFRICRDRRIYDL